MKITTNVKYISIFNYKGNSFLIHILFRFLKSDEKPIKTFYFQLLRYRNIRSLFLDNTVRLVGGSNEYVGRLEVFYNGVWGTVCGDGSNYQTAAVVCRSLGLKW